MTDWDAADTAAAEPSSALPVRGDGEQVEAPQSLTGSGAPQPAWEAEPADIAQVDTLPVDPDDLDDAPDVEPAIDLSYLDDEDPDA